MTNYTSMFFSMIVNPEKEKEAAKVAASLYAHKDRYQAIKSETGVPWMLIAALHYRESNIDFNTYLGNGDSLKHKTVNDPSNRGPFASFEEGAIDALTLEGMTHQTVWGIENILYWAHRYNGMNNKYGDYTPYLWAGSNHYKKGMYVADHEFDPEKVDHRLGCAVIIEQLMILDAQKMRENKPYSRFLVTTEVIPINTKITSIVGAYNPVTKMYPLTRVQPWYERLWQWLKSMTSS